MKPAYLKDHALLHQIQSWRTEWNRLHVWWLGQSGFLIQWNEKHLLMDPYLSDSLTRKYAATNKPHVRITEPVLDPACLNFINVVTSSHNHTDHLDPDTLLPLIRLNPALQFLAPEANRNFISNRLGLEIDFQRGIIAGEIKDLGGFRFHGIPAAHNTLTTDDRGHHLYMGYVVEIGPWKIYHPGDTRPFPGLDDILRYHQIDLAFLPINGDRPERGVAGNLDATEAVLLAQSAGIKLLVPCHYDMFEFNTADPLEFAAVAETRGVKNRILRNGEGFTLGPEMKGSE